MFKLTDTSFGEVKEVDENPVSADCVVCRVERPVKDVTLWTREVNIIKLKYTNNIHNLGGI